MWPRDRDRDWDRERDPLCLITPHMPFKTTARPPTHHIHHNVSLSSVIAVNVATMDPLLQRLFPFILIYPAHTNLPREISHGLLSNLFTRTPVGKPTGKASSTNSIRLPTELNNHLLPIQFKHLTRKK